MLTARLMVAQLRLTPDRTVIEADETAQSLLGSVVRQPLNKWLERIEPAELHNLIGKVDIDSASIQIRDIAGIYTPAKLWQYRENSTSDWQIAIQIETQNATDENPLQKRFFAQQQLLSIISHELRTPAATLKMLIDDLAASNLSEQLPLLKESSEHLMSVLQDMRQATNPARNLPRALRTFHPNRLLESVASQVRRIAQTQGITLRMELYQDESIKVKTDLERCKLIALNLLKNAVIHSEGSEVSIGVNLKESNGSWQMRFSISDDGIGIEQPDIDRLLQPFERLEGLEQGGDGAGLGLFVVKQSLAELNGRLVLTQSKAGGLLA
jgi:signal transduction histidine kinase